MEGSTNAINVQVESIDLNNYYTKTEVDEKVASAGGVDVIECSFPADDWQYESNLTDTEYKYVNLYSWYSDTVYKSAMVTFHRNWAESGNFSPVADLYSNQSGSRAYNLIVIYAKKQPNSSYLTTITCFK